MKISSQQVQLIAKLYQEQQSDTRQAPKTATGSSGDKVIISRTSQEIRAAMTETAALPDIREERVSELRRRIADGTYEVPSQEVARTLVERIMVDRMLRDEV